MTREEKTREVRHRARERDVARLSESKVIWHPYPKEKPNVPLRAKSEWGWEYSVAYTFLTTQKRNNKAVIGVSLFYDGEFQDNEVIAWADVEPYKEVDE